MDSGQISETARDYRAATAALIAKIFIPTHRWHILIVNTNCEKKVCDQCKDLDYTTYFPTSKRSSELKGRTIEFDRPALPGYVFLSLPIAAPHYELFQPDFVAERMGAKPLYGSRGFLVGASTNSPLTVEPEIISDLKKREDLGEFDWVIRDRSGRYVVPRWVRRRAKIRIIGGPFASFPGTIEKAVGRKSVLVTVYIFGRATTTTMPLEWIERGRN